MDKTKIVLYGYGGLAKKAISFYKEKTEILLYVDGDERKWGQTDCGIRICGIEELHKLDFDLIVITSMFHHEISETLSNKGFEQSKITFFSQMSDWLKKDFEFLKRNLPAQSGHDKEKAWVKTNDQVESYFYLSPDREVSITKRESEAFFKTNAPRLPQERYAAHLAYAQRYVRENSVFPLPPKTFYLSNDHIFIDGGSFLGHTCLKAKVLYPDIITYAIEASKSNHEFSRHHAKQISHLDSHFWLNAALDCKTGTTELNMFSKEAENVNQQVNTIIPELNDQTTSNQANLQYSQKVNAITIDEILADCPKSKPVFISLEINGSEPQALLGAINLLESDRKFFIRAGWRYFDKKSEFLSDCLSMIDGLKGRVKINSPPRWELMLHPYITIQNNFFD